MSHTKTPAPLPPLVTDALIAMGFDADSPRALTPYAVKAIYEADRAKTREVVQALVDDLSRAYCIDKPSLSQAKLILNIEPTKP